MAGTRVVAVEKERVVRFQRHLAVQLPGYRGHHGGPQDFHLARLVEALNSVSREAERPLDKQAWSPDGRPGRKL